MMMYFLLAVIMIVVLSDCAEVSDIASQNLDGATLGVQDGLDGVLFVDACQRSSRDEAYWIDLR
jgi:hypothetical protein